MLALARKAIVRSPFLPRKAISSTELPDYRGVFTRSTLRVGSNKKTGFLHEGPFSLVLIIYMFLLFQCVGEEFFAL